MKKLLPSERDRLLSRIEIFATGVRKQNLEQPDTAVGHFIGLTSNLVRAFIKFSILSIFARQKNWG